MALVTRQGSGNTLTQSEGDTNWDTLNGINEAVTAATHTVDQTDELKTIEYNRSGGITVTLTAIATINSSNDSQISDFKTTLKNIGTGDVTINCSSTDTFEDGTTSQTLKQYDTLTLQTDSTGGKWNIVGTTSFIGKTLASTDDVIDNFPAGTAMVFYQASAPTGWTGSDALSDHAIQIVTTASTNGGSTGGTVNFSTVFGRTATDEHVLDITQIPAHSHTYSGFGSGTNWDGGSGAAPATLNTSSVGGGLGHSHNIDLQVKYAQVIIATKD